MLIDNICLLITSQSREVVNPSISFLHVFIQVQPVMESAKFCEKIVNSLCKMTEDCKRHFRLKTRYVRFFFSQQVAFLTVRQNHAMSSGIIQLSVAYVGPLCPLTTHMK